MVSPFPSFGEGGVAESRGGRWIHNADNNRLTHSPTTSPYGDSSFPKEENGEYYRLSNYCWILSTIKLLLNTIDYQIIIFLIKFTTKFEEEPVFIDLTLMPSLIVYIPLFIRNAAMRVTTRSSLRVNSYLQTVFSGEFPIHLLLKAYGIKTWSNKEAERFTFISLFVNLR